MTAADPRALRDLFERLDGPDAVLTLADAIERVPTPEALRAAWEACDDAAALLAFAAMFGVIGDSSLGGGSRGTAPRDGGAVVWSPYGSVDITFRDGRAVHLDGASCSAVRGAVPLVAYETFVALATRPPVPPPIPPNWERGEGDVDDDDFDDDVQYVAGPADGPPVRREREVW